MSLSTSLSFAGALGAGALAIGALARPRRQSADWAFAAGMLTLAAAGACAGLTAFPPRAPASLIRREECRLAALSLLPGCWLWFSLSYARGDARSFLRRWRLPLAVAFLLPVGLALGWRHGLIVNVREAGPGSAWTFGLGAPGLALNFLLLAGAIAILMNLERTFRASVGTLRWRIKYMLMGVGLLFAVRVYLASQALLFHRLDSSLDPLDAGTLLVASLLMLRSFFRAGRADLDVYASPSVLRGSVTVLLAGIYLLAVGLSARVVAWLGGGNAFALEAFLILLALALAVVLLQSDRLRMRLGRFISRHFQRPLYDYRTVWRRFAEVTPAQVEPVELCRSLAKLLAEVFQTLSVAIWLVDDQAMVLAASTFLSAAQGLELAPTAAEAGPIVEHFLRHPDPADLESVAAPWAAALRRMHPSEFPRRENRVGLPLIARGRVIALFMLGDRVGGAAFSTQDFEMLTCVGDHALASLLAAQAAQKLLHSRELAAFQAMAAFFVHDLKNAASSLSLMLGNLPVHFDDPAFRADALRGVAKSVQHINQVIGHLGLLRHELKIRPVESDLNSVADASVAGLEADPGFRIAREFSRLPPVPFDREQIAKVVTNLVLNAKESMSGRGRVRIATGLEPGWAVLAVADEGCGMSADFIARSLFRPFQTTKKNGLGIGMFQSRMIVEVHGGRITVASEPGRGTTFRVFLPLQGLVAAPA